MFSLFINIFLIFSLFYQEISLHLKFQEHIVIRFCEFYTRGFDFFQRILRILDTKSHLFLCTVWSKASFLKTFYNNLLQIKHSRNKEKNQCLRFLLSFLLGSTILAFLKQENDYEYHDYFSKTFKSPK